VQSKTRTRWPACDSARRAHRRGRTSSGDGGFAIHPLTSSALCTIRVGLRSPSGIQPGPRWGRCCSTGPHHYFRRRDHPGPAPPSVRSRVLHHDPRLEESPLPAGLPIASRARCHHPAGAVTGPSSAFKSHGNNCMFRESRRNRRKSPAAWATDGPPQLVPWRPQVFGSRCRVDALRRKRFPDPGSKGSWGPGVSQMLLRENPGHEPNVRCECRSKAAVRIREAPLPRQQRQPRLMFRALRPSSRTKRVW
jgi:hypothetical protein